MSLRVLLVGNGGREHALARKLSQSAQVQEIFVVPGNGGTALEPRTENITTVKPDDYPGLLKFAIEKDVNLLVPGPEAPLVDGIIDYFKQHGPAKIECFGPSKAAAQMEGSKAFAKDFMARHNIPTAAYETFTDFEAAKQYLLSHKHLKVVIKADGLAGGKGVIIPETFEEAVSALETTMLRREFGDAGNSVVIEEFLEGEEISILSFSDGYSIASLPAAQDHKRVNENDEGKNTGGMGCYAPTQIAGKAVMDQIHREILQPTINGMRRDGYPMVGCLFTGLMLTPKGPKVLEYNVRFGDPESQTLLPLMENDLAEILIRCTQHTLDATSITVKSQSSVTVVVAAGGYPDSYAKNTPMSLSTPPQDTILFHAGTSLDADTKTVRTSGGRVIACTALGSNVSTAVDRAYSGLKQCIKFDKMHYRTDIARRELVRHDPSQLPAKQLTATAGSSGTVLESEPEQQGMQPMTYAAAGVSIDAGNSLVKRIKPLVAATSRPGADASIGGFGGLFSLAAAGYGASAPNLIFGIDGIGTKLLIAQALHDYSTVGIDLVAMNVNDLVVQGAEPLAFLDYYATGRLDIDNATSFVSGVAEGCRAAGCALVGGETAEMAGLYQGEDFDAAGCAIGAMPSGAKVLPVTAAMKEGDVLLGLSSSGAHSNGYSLIRKLVARSGLGYEQPAPWDDKTTLGRALLTPTRVYVKSLLNAIKNAPSAVKGMAHITGGGVTDNVPRMLPEHLAANFAEWELPTMFKWFKKVGSMEDHELVRTFNCGIGMVLVVAKEQADAVQTSLQSSGEIVVNMGSLVPRPAGNEGVLYAGFSSW